jgi:hypothetical protein
VSFLPLQTAPTYNGTSAKDIKPGKELLMDYGNEYFIEGYSSEIFDI